ncbi:WD40/YVTN/BNR-like repeat-containing protein [Cesiribacter andamanensis]|uniref:Plant photosystem II stability/assembly factor-like protein n=1 Tax=Cesiribacter andamanensis AMV16 TaxID=1279009 RepID=M7NHX0_9BACT|nr:hypothetical protein [Cesiribacter andamanensis]EMR01410.1 plant photosystem II stability/assembly factor-like protein [Cesiribacter andamanensis AMV16]
MWITPIKSSTSWTKASPTLQSVNLPRLVPTEAPLQLQQPGKWFAAGSMSTVYARQLPGETTYTYSERNLLWISDNAGSSWQKAVVPPLPHLMGLISISSQGSTCWALDRNGTILRSQDGGSSWTARRFDRYATEGVRSLHLSPNGRAYLITSYGELFMQDY